MKILLGGLLCVITSSSSIEHLRKTLKNTFHRIQQPFLRMNVSESMFTLFCLEPTLPGMDDSRPHLSIKMRNIPHSHDLFCVPLDESNTIP
jgi:hypothetical protein